MMTRPTHPALPPGDTHVRPPLRRESPQTPRDAAPVSDSARASANRRWWSIEWLGLTCGLLFFVGLFFAYRTYTSGLVTQSEFDALQPGFTLAQVNAQLGFAGRRVSPAELQSRGDQASRVQPSLPPAAPDMSPDASPAMDVYRWENSTRSWVECHFLGDRLQQLRCCRLP